MFLILKKIKGLPLLTLFSVLEWLKEERGVMFVTRLRQMAALKSCVDLALRLATAVMQRYRLCIRRLSDIEQMESQNGYF